MTMVAVHDDDLDLSATELTEEQLFAPLSVLFSQKITKFPGALPESLDANNLNVLKYGYVCALKADGDRVFCLLEGKKMRMLRRNKQVKTLDLSFELTADFIFDAEWIEDLNLLLFFDTLLYANQPAWRLNYTHRLELARHFLETVIPNSQQRVYKTSFIHSLIHPLPSKYNQGLTWKHEALRVQVKPVYAPEDAEALWKLRSKMEFNCDGLIFTRLLCMYRPFCEPTQSVMKWKPTVTIDLYVEMLNNEKASSSHNMDHIPPEYRMFASPANEETCNVLLRSIQDGVLCDFSCATIGKKALLFCLGKICEFRWNDLESIWVLERPRLDKTSPNTLLTVYANLQSLVHKVHIQDITNLFSRPSSSSTRKRSLQL